MKTRSFALAALLSLAAASAAHAAGPSSSAVSDEARTHFKAGVAFLQDPDGARYEEAYREFKEAYRISPSWKILGNLGLTSLKLERNDEAIDAYEKYLAQGGKEIEAGERAQIERDLLAMKAASATVQLTSTGAAGDVSISDQRARTTGGAIVNMYVATAGKPLTLRVQAGHHTFVAKSGSKEARWETDLTGEQKTDHAFAFDVAAPPASARPPATTEAPKPPPAEKGGGTLRTVGYVTAGVGGAMLIGGVVTGLLAKGKFSDLDAACPDRTHCPTSNQSTADSVSSLATMTNIFLIGGGVLAAGGVAMIVLGKPSDTSGGEARSVVVTPSGGPGLVGLTAAGRF